MKKLLVIITAFVMALSITACGDKPAPASSAATKPASSTAAKPADDTKPADDAAAAEEEEMAYELDYDVIAEWVAGGYLGTDASGAPVVLAIDEANENAIIIFGDNTDMTAVSFVGAITYTETTATITDEANQSTLTFGVNQTAEDTIELDMGDIGKATIKSAAQADILTAIKNAIENYKHVM